MSMELHLGGYNVDADYLAEVKANLSTIDGIIVNFLTSKGIEIGDFKDDERKREFISENLFLLDNEERDEILKEVNKLIGYLVDHNEGLTPEPLAAAYARTSRLPDAINELRRNARLDPDKAARSVETIAGVYGHSSVAEHIVANMDLINGSRFLMEFLERMRIAAYTEKSGRYQLFKDDFTRPKEIVEVGLLDEFEFLQREQIEFYHELFERLFEHQCDLHPDLVQIMNHSETSKDRLATRKKLEGPATEDARYISSLSMETQVGITLNARQIEKAISRLSSSTLAENRQLATLMFDKVNAIMPSAIKHAGSTDFFKHTRPNLELMTDQYLIEHMSECGEVTDGIDRKGNVTLLGYDSNTEDKILAAIMHSTQGATGMLPSTLSYPTLLDVVRRMNEEDKRHFFLNSFKHMNLHDATLREFEHASMKWELIVDASEFAQLKRHRMGTQTYHINYDPSLGITIPESIIEIGMENKFREVAEGKTYDLYRKIEKRAGRLPSNYVLTNASRRRVIYDMNVREAYHFSRMREDGHAQWKIRETATVMGEILREKLPLACALLCGKDSFEETYNKLFKNE